MVDHTGDYWAPILIISINTEAELRDTVAAEVILGKFFDF
jgi:hypothetical protein